MQLGRRSMLRMGMLPVFWTGRLYAASASDVLVGFATPEPASLLPGGDPALSALAITSKMFEGLIALDADGQPVSGLAASWQWDAAGEELRFLLRGDVMFHDGRPLRGEDVVASLARAQAESPLAGFGWISDVRMADAQTVAMRMQGQPDHLMPMLATSHAAVLPRGAGQPVGTGPFQLAEWRRGDSIGLQRFPQYRQDGASRVNRLIYRVMPDPVARIAALRGGAAQWAQGLDIPPEALAGLASQPGLRMCSSPDVLASVCRLDVNHARGRLGDARVRQAIGLAVDRGDLIRRVWAGAAHEAAGPLPAVMRLSDPPITRDPRQAAALLTEAGCVPDDDGVRLRLPVLVPGGIWRDVAESLAVGLRQVGIALAIETIGTEAWATRVARSDYDATLICLPTGGTALLGLASPYGGFNRRAVLGANTGGYNSADIDLRLLAARDATTEEAHRLALRDAERLLIADAAQIWLFEPINPVLASTGLHEAGGTAPNPYGNGASLMA